MDAAAAHHADHEVPLTGTGGVGLRPYRPDDEENLIKLANNPKVAANLRDLFPRPYTSTQSRCCVLRAALISLMVRHLCGAHAEESAARWMGIVLQIKAPYSTLAITVDNEFAGSIGLSVLGDVHRHSAEVGYCTLLCARMFRGY